MREQADSSAHANPVDLSDIPAFPPVALRVLDLWWEDGFDPLDAAHEGFVEALAETLRAHAAFADANRVVLPRTARHRDLAALLRPRLAEKRVVGSGA